MKQTGQWLQEQWYKNITSVTISNQQPTKTECMQRVGNEWAKSQIERHVITQSSAKGTPQSNPANYIG